MLVLVICQLWINLFSRPDRFRMVRRRVSTQRLSGDQDSATIPARIKPPGADQVIDTAYAQAQAEGRLCSGKSKFLNFLHWCSYSNLMPPVMLRAVYNLMIKSRPGQRTDIWAAEKRKRIAVVE
jgi:hypothetical protein